MQGKGLKGCIEGICMGLKGFEGVYGGREGFDLV